MITPRKYSLLRPFVSLAFLLTTILFSHVLFIQDSVAEATWSVAPGRSTVGFSIKHFMLMKVKGKFRKSSGTVITKSGMDFSGAKVDVSVPVSSIYTGNEDRDAHLVSADFFNTEEYPDMKFKSTKVVETGKGTYDMSGLLTIRGTALPVTFKVRHKRDTVLPNGKMCCYFTAIAKLNRYDFGLTWNELTEAGSFAVGQEVEIAMKIALIKQS